MRGSNRSGPWSLGDGLTLTLVDKQFRLHVEHNGQIYETACEPIVEQLCTVIANGVERVRSGLAPVRTSQKGGRGGRASDSSKTSLDQIQKELRRLYRLSTNGQITPAAYKTQRDGLLAIRSGMSEEKSAPAYVPMQVRILSVPSGCFLSEEQIETARECLSFVNINDCTPLQLDDDTPPGRLLDFKPHPRTSHHQATTSSEENDSKFENEFEEAIVDDNNEPMTAFERARQQAIRDRAAGREVRKVKLQPRLPTKPSDALD